MEVSEFSEKTETIQTTALRKQVEAVWSIEKTSSYFISSVSHQLLERILSNNNNNNAVTTNNNNTLVLCDSDRPYELRKKTASHRYQYFMCQRATEWKWKKAKIVDKIPGPCPVPGQIDCSENFGKASDCPVNVSAEAYGDSEEGVVD